MECKCVYSRKPSLQKFQFTKKQKKQEKNCHRPVILTARAELGLGDHLIQCFSPKIFLLKIQNIEQMQVKNSSPGCLNLQQLEKSFSHVKVGLYDTALEAPSLLEGAGLEIGQERHPLFVFLMLWSRAEDEAHSQL